MKDMAYANTSSHYSYIGGKSLVTKWSQGSQCLMTLNDITLILKTLINIFLSNQTHNSTQKKKLFRNIKPQIQYIVVFLKD